MSLNIDSHSYQLVATMLKKNKKPFTINFKVHPESDLKSHGEVGFIWRIWKSFKVSRKCCKRKPLHWVCMAPVLWG